MERKMILVGALSAGLSVILGALGSHALATHLDESALNTFEIGVRYQFYHSLAILLMGVVMKSFNLSTKWPYYWFIDGIVLFSGSLYLLALADHHPIPTFILGPITPIGGVCFIMGWLWLAWTVWKKPSSDSLST